MWLHLGSYKTREEVLLLLQHIDPYSPDSLSSFHFRTNKMGIDAGFDMVPRLSRGTADMQNWARFLDIIQEYYKDDAQVEVTPNCILFKAGEHPSLPFEGHKFLRFSSKVSGRIAYESHAESYINTVTAVAKATFGSRIQYWDEGADQLGHYSWNEVNESLRSYDEVRRTSFPL